MPKGKRELQVPTIGQHWLFAILVPDVANTSWWSSFIIPPCQQLMEVILVLYNHFKGV